MNRHLPSVLAPLLTCLVFLLPAGASGWQYWCDDPSPTGLMQISRPTISWPMRPQGDTVLTSTRMLLNGRTVQAEYDEGKSVLSYIPPKALVPGKYTVTCRAVFDGKYTAVKTWSFAIASRALDELPEPNDDQKRAHAAANGYRHLMGLPEFRLDPRYCAAANSHVHYIRSHPNTKHTQIPGQSGFTGESPSDRAAAFGCPTDVSEGIAYRTDPVASVDGLIDAPYHRLPFATPGSPFLGVGYSKGLLVVNVGKGSGSCVAVYPVDGQRDVPTTWYMSESPDPLRLHKGLMLPVGYVISYHVRLPGVSRISVADARLTTDDGIGVPFRLNSAENDNCLRTDALIIPERPLTPDTTYNVSLTAITNSGIDASRSWSFRTRAADSTLGQAAQAQLLAAAARGELATVISILAEYPKAVDLADSSGATAMHYAAQSGSNRLIDYLVSKGASVNAKKKDGVTALMIAASLGKKDAVGALLASGADRSATDARGRTALSLAKEKRRAEIVQMLQKPTGQAAGRQ